MENDNSCDIREPNHLQRSINAHSAAFWDPISVFPAELAAMCVRMALPWSSGYSAVLLQLTSVCTKWQGFILSTPVLWSEIHAQSSAHDLQATVALSAHLSRKMPLHLVLWDCHGVQLLTTVKTALNSHLSRLHSLSFGDQVINREAGYESPIPLVTHTIQLLGNPPVVELDFGCTLHLNLSQLFTGLDLPLHVSIMSPIVVNFTEVVGRYVLLTDSIMGPPPEVPTVRYDLLPEILCDNLREQQQPSENLRNLSTLNGRLASLRHLHDLLGCPSMRGTKRLASSSRPVTPAEGQENKCRICGDEKRTLVEIVACIRGHLGIKPSKCPFCGQVW